MGIAGDILGSVVRDMVGDAMNAEAKAMKKSYEERKVGEATSEANKLAKESGLSADEAEVEISKSEEAAEEEVANSQKKPVLVWCQQGKAAAPNWLFFMLPHQHIFDSMENLMGYLAYVHKHNGDVDHYKRWFFFNKDKMRMS